MSLSAAVALHDLARGLRTGARLPTLQARLALALLQDTEDGSEPMTPARLAARLGVARATLHHAMEALRRKGWLVESVETIAVERVVIELHTVRRLTLIPRVTLTPPAALACQAQAELILADDGRE